MSALNADINLNYKRFLDSLWEKHLNPEKEFSVISLFCGGGGSSLGYSMAGIKEMLAVDFWDNAERHFKLNFPHIPFLNIDITKTDPFKIKEEYKIRNLDILDGSPPCQGFSRANKNRTISDNRNQLYHYYFNWIKVFQPKIFIMENVASMTDKIMRPIWNDILATVKELEYNITAKIIDASYLQVPQMRKRMIMLGINPKYDIKPELPKPINQQITVKESLRNIDKEKYNYIESNYRSFWMKLKLGANGGTLTKSLAFTRVKINPDSPIATIMKTPRQLWHWDEPRFLTIAEAKRLQSFPDQYQMPFGYSKAWQILGNSVPPVMMYHIALKAKELLKRMKA